MHLKKNLGLEKHAIPFSHFASFPMHTPDLPFPN